jgi:signal transduction histidine kinase
MSALERRCLLSVEPEEQAFQRIQEYLREVDDVAYEVVWADSLERGVELLGGSAFDVCLADFHLCGGGASFVRAVREAGISTPIILLIGSSSREIELAAREAGAVDLLEKESLSAPLLERAIRYAIQQRKANRFRLDLLEERAARTEAETALRNRDEFLAKLSHELRTPLAAVVGVASRLEHDGSLPAEARAQIAVVSRNALLEARLIDDLMDASRIVQGTLVLHREETDAARLLQQAIETCLQSNVSRRLGVVRELAADDHRLWGDPTRLLQAFWNLLSNAAKFTPAGGTITVRTSRDERGWLVVEVADDGVGIEPQELPRLFESYEQGSAARRHRTGGLGLGLAIARTVVEQHGGHLSVRSEGPGKGASFLVYLPASAPDEAGSPAVLPEEAEPPTVPQRPLHILLVEDHNETSDAFAALLRLLGHQVTQAASVGEGLEAARLLAEEAGALDLVISDLALGDGSGLDLMKELSERYGVPGIAVSGFDQESVIQESRDCGFDLHLLKPLDLASLSQAIGRLFGHREVPA